MVRSAESAIQTEGCKLTSIKGHAPSAREIVLGVPGALAQARMNRAFSAKQIPGPCGGNPVLGGRRTKKGIDIGPVSVA